MKIYSKLFLLFTLCIIQTEAFSQIDNAFTVELEQIRCEYEEPSGFTGSGFTGGFSPRPNMIAGGFQRELTSKSGDLKISMTVYYNDSTRKPVPGEETYKKCFAPILIGIRFIWI